MSSLQKLINLECDARKFGFDWPNSLMILDQIMSECQEVREEIENGTSKEKLQEEISDLIHAVISLCLFCGFDVDETVDKAKSKFHKRMALLKEITIKRGLKSLQGQNIDFMLRLWDEVKTLENSENIKYSD